MRNFYSLSDEKRRTSTFSISSTSNLVRLLQRGRDKISEAFATFRMAYSACVILMTLIRIPKTWMRLSKYFQSKRDEKERELIWRHSKGEFRFERLPTEIQLMILEKMDVISICRISQTSSALANICLDNVLWIKKITLDWPDYSSRTYRQKFLKAHQTALRFFKNSLYLQPGFAELNDSKGCSERIRALSPGIQFYRQRYLSFKRFSLEPRRKRPWNNIETILNEERQNAFQMISRAALFPLKLAGFLTWPLHWLKLKRNQSLRLDTTSCLRRK